MKVNLNQGVETKGGDDFKRTNFRFSQESMGHVFKSVTTYSNPVGSVVREITSNCFDSHKRAGVDRDVEIEIIRGNKLEGTQDRIKFKDFGTGLSENKIRDIFTVVGASDKRLDNVEIGGFGLGAKSPFGYIRDYDYLNSFEVDTWYEGKHTKFALSETNDGPQMIEMFSSDSDRTNGTTVTIPIANYDLSKFKKEIKKQLVYFDNIKYVNCGVEENDYRVFKGNHFIYRDDIQPHNEMHVCYGKVAYPLNFSEIGLTNNYSYRYKNREYSAPIGLYFDIGEIDITPKREALLYNDKTVEAIKEKIELAREELQNHYDSQFDNVTSIEDYIKHCQSSKNKIIFNDVEIPISDGLVKIDSPRYPKYDSVHEHLPTSINSIFQQFRNYKIVDHKGHINTSISERDIDYLINNFPNNTFLVDTKYQTKKNKFMCSSYGENLDDMYLIKKDEWKTDFFSRNRESFNGVDNDKLTDEEKMLGSFQCGCHSLPNPNKEKYDLPFSDLRLLYQFYEEVSDYVINNIRDYNDIEVTEEYEEYLSDQRKKKNKSKASKGDDDEFPVKCIELDSGWSDDFKWAMTSMKYGDLNNETTYIYGFSDDDEKLLDLGPFWKANRSKYTGHRKGKQTYGMASCGKRRLEILKIAMSRESLFEDLDNAYHIDEFMDRKYYDPFFVRPVIDGWLYIHFNKNCQNENSLRSLDLFTYYLDELKEVYTGSSSGRDSYHSDIGQDVANYHGLDDDILNSDTKYGYYMQLARGIDMLVDKNYSLIKYTKIPSIYSDNNLREKVISELKDYVKRKSEGSNIHPALYYRLQQCKKNNNSN